MREFNRRHQWRKLGLAVVPAKFGLAFTHTPLNQGMCSINVYVDGSVLVSSGGAEMGQGVHTKVTQVVAQVLGIPLSAVYVRETNTDSIPNSSATAASMGTDLYCQVRFAPAPCLRALFVCSCVLIFDVVSV